VDDLVQAMGMSGISKSQVSRLCEDIDVRVKAFLDCRFRADPATHSGMMPPPYSEIIPPPHSDLMPPP
jgi:hypothetical protein